MRDTNLGNWLSSFVSFRKSFSLSIVIVLRTKNFVFQNWLSFYVSNNLNRNWFLPTFDSLPTLFSISVSFLTFSLFSILTFSLSQLSISWVSEQRKKILLESFWDAFLFSSIPFVPEKEGEGCIESNSLSFICLCYFLILFQSKYLWKQVTWFIHFRPSNIHEEEEEWRRLFFRFLSWFFSRMVSSSSLWIPFFSSSSFILCFISNSTQFLHTHSEEEKTHSFLFLLSTIDVIITNIIRVQFNFLLSRRHFTSLVTSSLLSFSFSWKEEECKWNYFKRFISREWEREKKGREKIESKEEVKMRREKSFFSLLLFAASKKSICFEEKKREFSPPSSLATVQVDISFPSIFVSEWKSSGHSHVLVLLLSIHSSFFEQKSFLEKE